MEIVKNCVGNRSRPDEIVTETEICTYRRAIWSHTNKSSSLKISRLKRYGGNKRGQTDDTDCFTFPLTRSVKTTSTVGYLTTDKLLFTKQHLGKRCSYEVLRTAECVNVVSATSGRRCQKMWNLMSYSLWSPVDFLFHPYSWPTGIA